MESNCHISFSQPRITITYALEYPAAVELVLVDMLGRRVATLVDGYQYDGQQTIQWNAEHMASGVYVARLKVGSRLTILRLLKSR